MAITPTGTTEPLTCPSCGDTIAPDDVNIELMVAMCRSCASMVELSASAPAPEPRARPPEAILRWAAPPKGLTVSEADGALSLRRQWFQPDVGFFFLLLWCVVWDGFLVVWYMGTFARLASGDLGALGMMLFPLLHVAAGVGVTYLLVARALNQSTITIDASHLRVSHGPLPWPAPNPLPVRSIDQLYLVQRDGKNARTFTLVARLLDRTSVELLSSLPDDRQPRFMEQRIEAFLGLADQQVEGEYSG